MRIDSKTFRFGKTKIKVTKCGPNTTVHINLGRYKKRRSIDTCTLYDSISGGILCDGTAVPKPRTPYSHIWIDTQNDNLVGLEVCWDE